MNLGKESISDFIETAHRNTLATFNNLPDQYEKLKKINDIYWKVINNFNDTSEWFSSLFLLRSHAAYLGSVRFAASGQCTETYMVLRGCLEAAIYGLYLSQKKESQEVWLRRHDNEASLKSAQKEFRIGELFKLLNEVDPEIYRATRVLYDRTIDFGAHPNELAFTSLIKTSEDSDNKGKIKIDLQYLTADTPFFYRVIETTVEVGICALCIFMNIYQDLFKDLGIDKELEQLKDGLKKDKKIE